MKRQPTPTNEEIQRAFDAAAQGRGTKLADLIRSFSREDLVAGLSHARSHLTGALFFAAGRKEFRQKLAAEIRERRKKP